MLVVKEAVKSNFTNKHSKSIVYAAAYTPVEIIAEHHEIIILRNSETGIKFPCQKSNIVEIEKNKKLNAYVVVNEKPDIIPLSSYNFNKFENKIEEKIEKVIVPKKKNTNQTSLW